MRVAQAVIVVTGAGHGIGRATALALADRRALVTAVDRDSAALDELDQRLGGASILVDVTDPSHADAVVKETLASHGRIDAIVAIAGFGYAGEFATMPESQIGALLDVNLR